MVTLEFVPTYEYECPRCPRTFEVRQRISEPALTTCDRCGSPIRRLLAAAPFILKGGGWHVTDYPSEARKKARSSETGDKPAVSEPKSSTAESAPSGTGSGERSSASSSGSKESSDTSSQAG